MMKARVMVVEDESIVAKNIQARLKQLGYIVPATFSSGEEALENIENIKPNLVLMDIVLDGKIDGLETAEIIHNRYKIPIVYLTAYADDITLERAKKSVPFGYLVKPFEITELKSAIEIALNSYSNQQKLIEKSERLEKSFNTISYAVLVIDRNGRINLANTQAELSLGFDSNSLRGQEVEKFIKIPDSLGIGDFLLKNQHIHTQLLNKSNNHIPICIDSNPIRNEMGGAIGSLVRFNISNDRNVDPCIKMQIHNYEHISGNKSVTIGIMAQPKLLIQGIKNLIMKNQDINVIFEESEFKHLEDKLRFHDPEILCINDSLTESEIGNLIEMINQYKLKANIILLMNRFDQNLLINALSLGVKGCLSCNSESIKLLEAIRTVQSGNIWLEVETLNQILPKLLSTSKKRKYNISNHNLTRREEEIAKLIMKGYSNKNIAQKLYITEKTVKTHLTKIFKKLGINNRLELAVKFNLPS